MKRENFDRGVQSAAYEMKLCGLLVEEWDLWPGFTN